MKKPIYEYGLIRENNIVDATEYFDRASKTISVIADALSKSLGYYGSTTIIEDNVKGNIITKDGFTILRELRFGIDDTLSNTLLKTIVDISHSLVMEVGDGSTSAVVTSEALFNALTNINYDKYPALKNVPTKVLIDELHKIADKIEEIIKESYATPITDKNFDVVKSIATVSNNNDEKFGSILYDIYKEIGKDGFVFIEGSLTDEDHFEISNGIEFDSGLIDNVYANKDNGMESEYENAKILLVKGHLKKTDTAWFMSLLGTYYQNFKEPLVIVGMNYDKEFLDFLKINKMNNDRNPQIAYEMGVTHFNSNKVEEFLDIAAYIGAEVLDLEDDVVADEQIKCFVDNLGHVPMMTFFEHHLGTCKKVYMNPNFSRLLEGGGSEEAINGRIELIDKNIEYFESQAHLKDVKFDLFKLNRRKGNLKSKIAKLYVSGKTYTEIETRKYLIEDAVHASKSALEHGYVSGGNLLVSKVLYHDLIASSILNESSKPEVTQALMTILLEAFKTTFTRVLYNAGINSDDITSIVDKSIVEKSIYNLKTNEFEKDSVTTIINSAMTDIKILRSVISIIGLIVTSNQYIQKSPRRLDLL